MKLLILGTAWPDWLNVLKDKKLWKDFPQFQEVIFAQKLDLRFSKYPTWILPLLEEDIDQCHAANLVDNVLVPSKETLEICRDKKVFYRFAVKNGFQNSMPKKYSLLSLKIDFPVILKPTAKNASAAISVCNNRGELFYNAKSRIGLREILLGRSIIQKYIKGKEYNFYSVCVDGEIKWSYTRMRSLVSDTFSKPKSVYDLDSEALLPQESYLVLKKILKSLNFNGPSCIDFTLQNQTTIIFEINPRMGGGLFNAPHLREHLVQSLKSTLG